MNLGIFTDDKFGLVELTAAINEAPSLPAVIGGMGLFEEEGILTTAFAVEKDVETLALIPNQSRAAQPVGTGGGSRSVKTFSTTHLPTQDTITADEIQNLRVFGMASEVETMRAYVDKRLARMRRRLEATIEYQRVGAIKGLVLDADGTTVITNLFTEFGLAQQTHQLALNSATADIRGQVMAAMDLAEEALGAEPHAGFHCICGKDFFRALIAHDKVQKAYELYESGAYLREDVRNGFALGGVTFSEYRGAIGGAPFVADDEAYLFPVGVDGMFITRYAPANYAETANTIGLPFYAKTEPTPLGKGVLVEAQSNPLSICTRPRAVIKLTIAP